MLQSHFEKLHIQDLEREKFCLDGNGKVAVRVKLDTITTAYIEDDVTSIIYELVINNGNLGIQVAPSGVSITQVLLTDTVTAIEYEVKIVNGNIGITPA